MPNFNRVIIAGHLTRDVEVRYTTKGTAIGSFGIAVNRKSADFEEKAFVDVTVFGKGVDTLKQYVQKGSPLLVEGRLKTEEWTDKASGQKRSKLVLICESFQFLNSGDRKTAPAPTATADGGAPAETDDDVPF
jgi:single-strand DNA-binding protein